jgi:uncharacterized protein (TIGR04255 family)
MTNRRRYKKSPLTEAVIDIRVELPPGIAAESLGAIHRHIESAYPQSEELQVFQGSFTIGAAPTSTQKKLGYRYRSKDDKYMLQVRTNGFTLSRLPLYDQWEPFRDEARRLWDIYKEVAKPVRANRLAVRYINRIDISSSESIELKDYFRTYPEVSSDLPQLISGYAMQIFIPQPEFGGMLSLIQASVPAPKPGVFSFNLDLDLFKESNSDFDSDEKIWNFLEYLGDKNDGKFDGCLTEQPRQLFEPVCE